MMEARREKWSAFPPYGIVEGSGIVGSAMKVYENFISNHNWPICEVQFRKTPNPCAAGLSTLSSVKKVGFQAWSFQSQLSLHGR